jgi:Lipoprotein LpqB beta-propeller domain
MVAVSPDSKYAAGVGPAGKAVYVWASGGTKPSSSLTVSGVTAIGWDRRDDLWVAHGGTTTVIGPLSDDSSSHADVPNAFQGKIIGLDIAPDGVRAAAIVQTGSSSAVELAAIDTTRQSSNQLSNPSTRTSAGQPVSIGATVHLGPNITNPIALTWYDADDLLVLNATGNKTTLWEVPVDGQPATQAPGVLPDAISITANSAQNALVAGMTQGRMEVSASLEGPWQTLVIGGQNPAFPVPAIPVAAQS